MTLTELSTATAVMAVVAMVGWATWEMTWRGLRDTRSRTQVSRNCFATLHRIEQEVMRGTLLEVPDPDYSALPSMQVRVSVSGALKRRAFRLVNNALVIHLKDEGVAPYNAFDGIGSLSFTLLDPPTNSMVRITCTCVEGGQTVEMQTVATKRN